MAVTKIKKLVKKSTATAKRVAVAAVNKVSRTRAEVKGRSKARRAVTRTVSSAAKSVKTAARRKAAKK
jgi:hypothetical protein